MNKPLNTRQRLVLTTLRALPARYRHQRRAGAPIRYEALECYDWRTLDALVARGFFTHTEFGLAHAAVAPDLN